MILERMIALTDSLKEFSLEESFSKKALKALSAFEVNFSLEELESEIALFLSNSPLPKQLNLYNSFGQPPITLYNDGKMVVDLYFWMHADTSIHDHSFAGAFKVVSGKSHHEEYSFQTTSKISEDVELIDLNVKSTEELVVGDTKEIKRGESFVHKVVHLDRPTVTLCLRTVGDVDKSQWHYFPNGLRVKKIDSYDSLTKSLLFMDYMAKRNPASAEKMLVEILERSTNSELLNFYERLSYDPMDMDENTIEVFFSSVYAKFKNEEWFQTYLAYYDSLN